MSLPFVEASRVYKREACARTFEQDLHWHFENGFVFSRPDFFIMGRAVVSTASYELIVGQYRFPSVVCDAWHVYLAAGNLMKAWEILPWELPLLTFERNNELRKVPVAAMRRLCGANLT